MLNGGYRGRELTSERGALSTYARVYSTRSDLTQGQQTRSSGKVIYFQKISENGQVIIYVNAVVSVSEQLALFYILGFS